MWIFSSLLISSISSIVKESFQWSTVYGLSLLYITGSSTCLIVELYKSIVQGHCVMAEVQMTILNQWHFCPWTQAILSLTFVFVWMEIIELNSFKMKYNWSLKLDRHHQWGLWAHGFLHFAVHFSWDVNFFQTFYNVSYLFPNAPQKALYLSTFIHFWSSYICVCFHCIFGIFFACMHLNYSSHCSCLSSSASIVILCLLFYLFAVSFIILSLLIFLHILSSSKSYMLLAICVLHFFIRSIQYLILIRVLWDLSLTLSDAPRVLYFWW